MNCDHLKDQLIDTLCTLADNSIAFGKTAQTDLVILNVLTGPSQAYDSILDSISEARAELRMINPYADCSSAGTGTPCFFQDQPEGMAGLDTRTLKVAVIHGLREIAYSAKKSAEFDAPDAEVMDVVYHTLAELGRSSAPYVLYHSMQQIGDVLSQNEDSRFDLPSGLSGAFC